MVFSKTSHLYDIKISESVTIEFVKCAKILAVEVGSRLTFSGHVAGLCKKAGRHINALFRMSKSFDVPTKLVIMKTFVSSHFCQMVWHFCKSCDTLEIEKVQYRALKYVFNEFNCSYNILRHRANVPLLYTRRMKTVLLEIYKAYHS